MKKILISALMGLFIATSVSASSFTREDGTGGNVMLRNRKVVALGTYPGSVSALTVPMITMVDLTQGAPVVMVSVSSTTAGNGIVVSGTATLGDTNVIGIVSMPSDTTSVSALDVVQVAVGGVVIGRSAVSLTKGSSYCASGTAGKLTLCSAVTETGFTNISRSARVGYALETKTVTGGDGYGLFLLR